MRLLYKWGVASIFSDGSMRKLLLFLCCALGWCGQILSQRSVTDNKGIIKALAVESLGKQDTVAISLDSLAVSNPDLYSLFQVYQILQFVANDNSAAADSLLHVSIIDAPIDSLAKATFLNNLGINMMNVVAQLFSKAEYEKGRQQLEFIQPYLQQTLLPQWRYLYAASYFYQSTNLPFVDPTALPLLRRGLELATNWNFPDLTVKSIRSLGVYFVYHAELDSAFYYLEEAADLAQSYDLPDLRYHCLDQLTKVAWDYGDMMRYERANARLDSLENSIQDQYSYFSHQILRCERQQDWGKLELLLLKAEKWCDSFQGPLRYEYATRIYSHKARYYLRINDLDRALAYGQKALQTWKEDALHHNQMKLNLDEYPYVILSDLYQAKGDSLNQFAYLDSLVAYANHPNIDPFIKYRAYKLRGARFISRRDYDHALKDYEVSLSFLDKTDGRLTQERIDVLIGIGVGNLKSDPQKSLQVLRKAYELGDTVYGNPYRKMDLFLYLADACRLTGDSMMGCGYMDEYVQTLRSYVKTNFANRNPIEALSQIQDLTTNSHYYVDYLSVSNLLNSKHAIGAYEAYLMWSLWAMDVYRSSLSRIKQEGNEEQLHNYLVLQKLRHRMSQELKKEVDSRTNYEQLQHQIDSLDRVLRSESKAYGDLTRVADVDYQGVRSKLKPKEYLLNVQMKWDSAGNVSLFAFLVSVDQSYPVLLELSVPERLLPMNITVEPDLYEPPLSQDFLKLIWEPIASHIADGATVYYCSNEIFASFALENIPVGDGLLLGDNYHFCRISSVLSLFDKKEDLLATDDKPVQAVLYGGLRYDLTADEKAVAEMRYPVDSWFDLPLIVSRGDTCFQYLPGTEKEVVEISRVLEDAHIPTIVRKGADGTEHSFLSMSMHAPNILHLATHGYYAEGEDLQRLGNNANMPMLWSGLVLAGGNEEWRDTTAVLGSCGGLITSAEIAMMDLSNVDLLVLSACRTGKSYLMTIGDIGLLGAFKSAGVKSVIITLWEVSDRVTQEFMVKFYQELVDSKWDKRVAFEAAKAYIRKRYPEPVYWAGFVLVDG